MKLIYVFIPTFIIAIGVVILGESGLISAYKISQEKAQLIAKISRLQMENEILRSKIKAIKSDRNALEYEIRKGLSLVAKDEMLFEFE